VQSESGADNLRLLFDIYHLATNGDDVDAALASYADRIGHVQIADSPGRHEPGSGILDIARYLDELSSIGYAGHVGLEYAPTGASVDSFGWLPREARGRRP
jgi:hydroxypyruvate isomerase